MSVQQAFNAQGIDPNFGAFANDPIWSDGWSKVIITETDSQEAKNKADGSMLLVRIKAVEGVDTGKTGTVFVELWHTDPVRRDRAIARMSAICFAVGIFGYNSTAELHNRPFFIENKAGGTRKVGDKDVPTNNFSGVRNIDGVEPGKSAGMGGGGQAPGAPQAPGQPQGGWAPPPGQPAAPQQQQYQQPPGQPQGGPPQGGWTPPGGAPAGPSFAPNGAPAGAPAPQQGWTPPPNGQPQQQMQQPPMQQQQPPQAQQWQQPGAGQPQQQQAWQPGNAPPAGGGWQPPGR